MQYCGLKNEIQKETPEKELIDWLFSCKDKFSLKHPRDMFLQKPSDQIADELTLQLQKKPSVSSLWGKSVLEDSTVTIFDDVKYLFKNDNLKRNQKKDFSNNDFISFLKTSGTNTRSQQKLRDTLLVKKDEEFETNVESNLNKSKVDMQPFISTSSKLVIDGKKNKRVLDDDETSLHEKKIKVETALLSSNNTMLSKTSTENGVISVKSNKNGKILTSSQNGLVTTGKKIIKSISSYVTGHKRNNVEIVEDEKSVGSTSRVECPMCRMLFDEVSINIHAFNCQGPILTRNSSRSSQVSNQNILFNQDDWIKACENLDPKFQEETLIPDEVLQKYVSDNVWKTNSKQKDMKSLKFTRIPSREILVEEKKKNLEVFKQNKDLDKNFCTSNGSETKSLVRKMRSSENTSKIKNASKRNFDDSQNELSDFKCCKCQEIFTTVALLQCHTDECLSDVT